MKIPVKPKPVNELFKSLHESGRADIFWRHFGREGFEVVLRGKYRHWDNIRHLTPPNDFTHEEWWLGIKLARNQILKSSRLLDTRGAPFRFGMPDLILQLVHEIDQNASGRIQISKQVTNPETRDQYLINSLIEEAITSSQLEGASTTAKVAKEMIRSGRKPKDRAEQMILNNYRAMRHIREFVGRPLNPRLILDIHRIITLETLDSSNAVGRFRKDTDDTIVVIDQEGNVLHTPPKAAEIRHRVQIMCDFANGHSDKGFIHPVIRAIILHFWLAYIHPFVDGNGRTARAIFYWSMLSHGYWLTEYISISNILRNAPAKYARSFLYTETDDNDMNYFIVYQLSVIQAAISNLNTYLAKKMKELRETEGLLRRSELLNHRQLGLLTHAIKHPSAHYTIHSHKTSHNVTYQTARSDLQFLTEKKLVEMKKIGRRYYYYPTSELADKLRRLR